MEAIHHLINFHFQEKEPHLHQRLHHMTQYQDCQFQNVICHIMYL
ncbi:hypothetical protein T01_5248, partial [Trichinella spiralis]